MVGSFFGLHSELEVEVEVDDSVRACLRRRSRQIRASKNHARRGGFILSGFSKVESVSMDASSTFETELSETGAPLRMRQLRTSVSEGEE